MRIINAGYELITEKDKVKKIEQVARTCYKSESNIKDGSAERMVKVLVKNEHLAMLEHSSIILELNQLAYDTLVTDLHRIEEAKGCKPYLRLTRYTYSKRCIVSGNIRAWREYVELMYEDDEFLSRSMYNLFFTGKYTIFFEGLKAEHYNTDSLIAKEINPEDLTPAERLIHMDLTVKFTVDRGVSHEIVRHRVASFAQESTRYCNYEKKDITFIRPSYFAEDTPEMDNWMDVCMTTEKAYLNLIHSGSTPQEARAVLPNSLKTEVVMTANLKEWMHFFDLRALGTTGKPHPQIREVAGPLLETVSELYPDNFEHQYLAYQYLVSEEAV